MRESSSHKIYLNLGHSVRMTPATWGTLQPRQMLSLSLNHGQSSGSRPGLTPIPAALTKAKPKSSGVRVK